LYNVTYLNIIIDDHPSNTNTMAKLDHMSNTQANSSTLRLKGLKKTGLEYYTRKIGSFVGDSASTISNLTSARVYISWNKRF